MIKNEITSKNKNGIMHLYKLGKKIKCKPWLGDLFSAFYDSIMEKSVFPKKFEASKKNHWNFLSNILKDIHTSNILELATGSGDLLEVISYDNNYTGLDISKGLLKIASKKFLSKGFKDPRFYLCKAEELPFKDQIFDTCICNLSLNFFSDLNIVIKEIKRVLKNKGIFICSIPVPERNKKQSNINGKLYTEDEFKDIFSANGFDFSAFDYQNGAILYFKAEKK